MLKANNNLFNQDFANLSQVAPISTTHEEPEATTVVHQPLCEHVLHSLTNFLNNPENSGTDDLYDIVKHKSVSIILGYIQPNKIT